MTQLPFFQRLQPLTNEVIKDKAPAVFAEQPLGVSEKYTFIPTTQVIKDMESLGWNVYSVGQRHGRKIKVNSTNKHIVRFRNYDLEKVNGLHPEITLVNAHNGTSAFRFYVGLFNPNTGDFFFVRNQNMTNLSIRHQWYTLEEVRNMVDKVVNYLPQLQKEVELLSNVQISKGQQFKYVAKAVTFRWKENAPNVINEMIRAKGDMKANTLWEVFTYVQNKLIKGGMKYYTPTKRPQTVRQIKSIDLMIKINKELWDYTKEYVEKNSLVSEMV